MTTWIGIDNGLDGYICVFNDDIMSQVQTAKTPTIKGKASERWLHRDKDRTKRDYYIDRMAFLLREAKSMAGGKVMAIIEAPQNFSRIGGKQLSNATSLSSLQRGCALWEVACQLAKVPMLQVAAATWKAKLGLRGKVEGASKKDLAMAKAKELLPHYAFRKHDEAEAFLIAYWGHLEAHKIWQT